MNVKKILLKVISLTISILIITSFILPIIIQASSLTDSAKKTVLKTVEDIEKLNEVAEMLDDTLNLGIRVDKTFLLFDKKNFTFSDSQDFLSLNITLSYKDTQNIELESDKYD